MKRLTVVAVALAFLTLAGFALACQFVLAFGHVHLDKKTGSDAWAVAADGAQAGVKKLAGREGQLITLRRRSRLPWTAAVQPLTRAPRTAQLLIEIIGNPSAEGSRSHLVRRYQPLARGLDEKHAIATGCD